MDKPRIKKDYLNKIQKLLDLNKHYYDLSKPLVDDKEYDKIKLIKDTTKSIDLYKNYIDELHETKKSNAYNNIASNDKKQAVLNLTINDVNNVITKLK